MIRDAFGRFVKGHKPWNFKTRGLCKPNKTSFKIGNKFSRDIEHKRVEKVRLKLTLQPNLTMTKELAYLVGVLKGDGFTNINKVTKGAVVGVEMTDKKITGQIKNIFIKIGLNPWGCEVMPSNGISKKKRYRVQVYSKVFYQWYSMLSLEDLKNLLNKEELVKSFIAGFYDADGSLYNLTKNGNRSRVFFGNTNKELLEFIKNSLKKFNLDFNFNGPYKSLKTLGKKGYYHLETSAQENVKGFVFMIKDFTRRELKLC